MRVAVVTDSTAGLPAELAISLGIEIVPLRVQLGDRSGIEGVDISPDDVGKVLLARQVVTTSRPAPADFVRVYQGVLDSGAGSVVSVHLSAALSGTSDAARLAAAQFNQLQEEPVVRVVDSRSVAMGLGFAVLAAARAAAAGAPADVVASCVTELVARSSMLFYVDSLEWLRRGGRVGPASSRLATVLSVKPLLQVRDGAIVPLEQVRTTSKALDKLVEHAIAAAGVRDVDIAVQHLAVADRAADIERRLRATVPGLESIGVSQVGAVVGAHVGPGLIGIVVVPHRFG